MRVLLLGGVVFAACNFPDPRHNSSDAASARDAPTSRDGASTIDGGSCVQCRVLAMSPRVVDTGDVLALEGTFAADTSVTFPNGATAAASVLGGTHATVTVPANAGTGTLTVTSGGTAIAVPGFRAAPAPIALGSDTAGAPSLIAGRAFAMSATTSAFVYVFGSGPTERAAIQGDGTLGTFEDDPAVRLVVDPGFDTSVATTAFVYVIGGGGGGGQIDAVQAAPIRADGTLGSFEVLATTLPRPASGVAAAIIGDTLTVLGGEGSDDSKLATIARAPILTDGTLGAFTVEPIALTQGRLQAAAAVVGDEVYVVGGAIQDGQRAGVQTVDRAEIGSDGALGSFAADASLATARAGAVVIPLGHALFAFGGNGPSGPTATIEQASIGSAGSLEPFQTSTSVALGTAVGGAVGAVVGNTVVIVAGQPSSGPGTTAASAFDVSR